MNFDNSVILITNEAGVAKILKSQLVLLRDIDSISICDYTDALKSILQDLPETILIHCNKEKEQALELIKKIRQTTETPIVLVLNRFEEDFILTAYDEGINDYFTLQNEGSEILMRTIWSLKKNELQRKYEKHYNILKQLEVINPKTGFYGSKYYKSIYENEFKNIYKAKTDAVFMCISATNESKTQITEGEMTSAIRRSLRNSDLPAHGGAGKYYILLLKTNLKGAFVVWERIKKNVGEEISICAGICPLENKDFKETEKDVTNALCEAISTKNDMMVVNKDETVNNDNWLDKINSTQKNFKLFKQAFNKKLEKVITPVFFQVQKMYEDKLFNTKVEQYSNSNISTFTLKSPTHEAELRITYPGFSKINIDIIYKGENIPENKRISLDLTEIDEDKLTNILEELINEFKAFTK